MKYMKILLLFSLYMIIQSHFYFCSESDNTLKQITDTRRDIFIYEDVESIVEADIGFDGGEMFDILDLYDYIENGSDIQIDIYTGTDVYSDTIVETGIDDVPDINIVDSALLDSTSGEDIGEDIIEDISDIQDIFDTVQCTDQCQSGSKRCADSSTLEVCADFNNDGCYEYGFLQNCDNGCANGDCIPSQCEEIEITETEPVIPSESAGGKYETTKVNGFNDDYLYNSTNYTKIGIRREWGGTIIFFGLSDGKPGMNSSNAIDANDTGREVQVAFYDPDRAMQNCAYNASCRTNPTSCPISITFLGWDPVQGGNRCNIGSGIESVNYANGILTVSTNPLFWNPDWDRSDCDSSGCNDPNKRSRRSDVQVMQKIRFITQHVVEVDYYINNLSDLNHDVTYQEMPTMYTANGKNGTPDLYKLFDSDGNIIPIDVLAGGDAFYYKNFQSSGGWVAMQNESVNYGVGIYYENKIKDFQGWQLRSLPFNNVRALFAFGIPAKGTVRARAYLSLGNYNTIKSEFSTIDKKLGPFGSVDVPINDSKVSGILQIEGWAMDNKGVVSVYALIDGKSKIQLNYGTNRPDVCKVWPGYSACTTNQVGFKGGYDLSGLSRCPHLIEVYAVDEDNNTRRIGSKRIIVE